MRLPKHLAAVGPFMIRVLGFADDQTVLREGLVALLAYDKELEIVGQANNGLEACALAKELKPDVILMDIRMPECDGITATAEILKENPAERVLILTTFDEDDLIIKVLKAGAAGYLLKDMRSDRIAAGIKTVYEGNVLLGLSTASKVVSHLDSDQKRHSEIGAKLKEKLSERRGVKGRLAKAKATRNRRRRFHISEGTVKNYVSQIFEQLGVRDRVQAALIAQQELQ